MCTNTTRYKGSARSGGIHNWFIQRWSGVLLVIMLLTHFYLSHFSCEHHYITYEHVMERLSDPAWKAFDLAFLYLASYHGIMGAWNVLCDYKICKICKVFIYGAFLALLTYLVIFGTITIVSIQPVGG